MGIIGAINGKIIDIDDNYASTVEDYGYIIIDVETDSGVEGKICYSPDGKEFYREIPVTSPNFERTVWIKSLVDG